MEWTPHILRSVSWESLESAQNKLVENVTEENQHAYLLLSEPLATYTAGRSAVPSDLIASEEELKAFGATTFQVSRGGKWTYHGPGQLLLYPIVSLQALGLSSKQGREFVNTLRDATLDFLKPLISDVVSEDEPYGIFVHGKKLVSFGLEFKNGITRHGLALYLSPQVVPFKNIHPCGTPGQQFTSLEEEGVEMSWNDAALQLSSIVKLHFARLVEKR